MRTFKQIYRELKHYSAFNKEPSTPSQAIISTNVFFAEMADDLGLETVSNEYEFLVQSYRSSASQYIINFENDTRTFKQFLKSIYENLQVKEAA
ncbi:hypothetical protein ACSFBI_05225 [Variovorax sp. RB3P1]|uniref:hypothetical protein n=1 Tax=Variovorax sp. RB3P1 TaxID=3443732 RepID=UPI003F45D8BB